MTRPLPAVFRLKSALTLESGGRDEREREREREREKFIDNQEVTEGR